MSEKQRIGIAELQVAKAPEILITYGLGSCLGITLYDGETRTGGMAHTLLPSPRSGQGELRPAKFVETAIAKMVGDLVALGAGRERLVAKLVGGANMFENLYPPNRELIGDRNAQVARETLAALDIPIVGEDTGGNFGRTAELHLATGQLRIKSIRGQEIFTTL